LASGDWVTPVPRATPLTRGVDRFFGYNCQRKAHNYYPAYLWDNRTKVRFPENDGGKSVIYSQEVIQGEVLKFIEQQQENPFFLSCRWYFHTLSWSFPRIGIIQKFRGASQRPLTWGRRENRL